MTSIAFPLAAPQAPDDRPFSVVTTFGPTQTGDLNEGIEFSLSEAQHEQYPVRAVCAGWLQIIGSDEVRLRVSSQYTIPANHPEHASAFVYQGVELLVDFVNDRAKKWLDDTGAKIVWDALLGDEPTQEEVARHILDGVIPLEIREADVGTPIGHVKNGQNFRFKVETTRRRITGVGGFNVADPAAHWALVASQGLLAQDKPFVDSLLGNELKQQLIVEIRDDRNTPIGRNDGSHRISVGGAEFSIANALTVMRVAAAPDAVLTIEGLNVQTGTLGTTVDDQYIFWDPIKKSSNTQRLQIALPASPAHIVVHCLRPADWFAYQDSLRSIDFVDPDAPVLQRYTRGNLVSVFVDGFSYFKDLTKELQSLTFWHMAGWSLDVDTVVDQENNYSMAKFMIQHKGKVTLLLYANPVILDPSSGVNYATPTAQATHYAQEDRVLWDTKQDDLAAAHMKVVVIKNNNGLQAYCGGMDIWPDRLTDRWHYANQLGTDEPGLHDVQLKVLGPVASELDSVLYERWADQKGVSSAYPRPVIESASRGPHLVQVARTAPSLPVPRELSYAPTGDRTIWNSLRLAIQKANQFIYIEDQYFSNREVAAEIEQRLRAGIAFVVIVVPKENWNSKVRAEGEGVFSILGDATPSELLSPLLKTYPDRIRVCYLVNEAGEPVYVHAKLQIVDDLLVSCGSANLDYRGMGNDPDRPISQECNVICIDEVVSEQGSRTFARNMRMELWAAHLMLRNPGDPTLADPISAFEKYWTPPLTDNKKPLGLIRHFKPEN